MESQPGAGRPSVPEQDKRYFDLYWNAQDLPGLNDRARALAATLASVIQELEVLKEMLRRKDAWDEDLYRDLRMSLMLSDHSSAGPAPWRHHSIYPYTLPEAGFLRAELSANEEEVRAFQNRAAALETQT